MTSRLAIADAALVARVSEDEIRAALESGDLRNLAPRTVKAWGVGRIARIIAESVKP